MSCPRPIADYPNILLAHGSGGRLMHQLIENIFKPAFKDVSLESEHDAAVLETGGVRFAFTTDSYVVNPLFFAGGDIGSLAVYGTVNDLAMSGAIPQFLSAGFILEEGVETEVLDRVVRSMSRAALKAGVRIVTGDTKVVDRGKGDKIFINTAGIGMIEHELKIHPKSVRPKDQILLSGDLGRHGMAIMAAREGLSFETDIQSDLAPLNGLVQKLLVAGVNIHCLRDLTRGGLASALNEISSVSGFGVHVHEKSIPVTESVRAACEILGLNPLYVANEGRFAAFVPADDAQKALSVLRSDPLGAGAALIGEVESAQGPLVTLTNVIGTRCILDMLSGDQLPRIC